MSVIPYQKRTGSGSSCDADESGLGTSGSGGGSPQSTPLPPHLSSYFLDIDEFLRRVGDDSQSTSSTDSSSLLSDVQRPPPISRRYHRPQQNSQSSSNDTHNRGADKNYAAVKNRRTGSSINDLVADDALSEMSSVSQRGSIFLPDDPQNSRIRQSTEKGKSQSGLNLSNRSFDVLRNREDSSSCSSQGPSLSEFIQEYMSGNKNTDETNITTEIDNNLCDKVSTTDISKDNTTNVPGLQVEQKQSHKQTQKRKRKSSTVESEETTDGQPKRRRSRKPRVYVYNPKPLQKKPGKPPDVAPADKDTDYWERRQRNNEAARKSRESRRKKELEVIERCDSLEKSNMHLKSVIRRLESRNTWLERIIGDYCNGISLESMRLGEGESNESKDNDEDGTPEDISQ